MNDFDKQINGIIEAQKEIDDVALNYIFCLNLSKSLEFMSIITIQYTCIESPFFTKQNQFVIKLN